jgi:hypothetical protein
LPCSPACIFISDPCPPSPSGFKVGFGFDIGTEVEIGIVEAVSSAAKIAVPARVEFIVIVDIVVVAGTSGTEVPLPNENVSSAFSVSDEVATGGAAIAEEDWTGDLAIGGTNAEVLEVELKVEEEADEEEDEACCKIRVRASSRLVRCTVVAKSPQPRRKKPHRKKREKHGGEVD